MLSSWVMSFVAIAMCLPAGVEAQPGADGGGGWDLMDVLMVLGFIGYSVLAMGLGAMLYQHCTDAWPAGRLQWCPSTYACPRRA